jgi:hypothetical protein
MNNSNYKSAIDNIQFSEELAEKTLDYIASHISPPQKKAPAIRRKNIRSYAILAAAACILALMLIIPRFNNNSNFKLLNSVGNVSVKYVNKAPSISSDLELTRLTEEELFHEYNTDIFMGKIVDIKNIEINLNGSIQYNAIAKIKIDKIYRGNAEAGKTVSILLPCPIDTNVWVEDTGVVSSMREGMSGIFMPIKYDKSSYSEANGAVIYFQDIAEYGFLDGERYAFLSTNNGLIFQKHAYQSIASANTLQEIEQYVMKMIK